MVRQQPFNAACLCVLIWLIQPMRAYSANILTADLSIGVRSEDPRTAKAVKFNIYPGKILQYLFHHHLILIWTKTSIFCDTMKAEIEGTRFTPRTKKSSSRMQLLACGETTNSNTNHAYLLRHRVNVYHSCLNNVITAS